MVRGRRRRVDKKYRDAALSQYAIIWGLSTGITKELGCRLIMPEPEF